jgi:hypothetical protein
MTTEINPETELTLEALLAAVPVRNRSVIEEKQETGTVLRVPVRKRWFTSAPFSFIFPFSRFRSVELDKVGLEVWKDCDGTRNIEQIVERFAQKHHISFHEARAGVLEFLKSITRRGLIVITGKPVNGGHK